MRVLGPLLLTVGLIASCAIVGSRIATTLTLDDPSEGGNRRRIPIGVDAAVGLAALLALAGLGVAFGHGFWPVLTVWVVATAVCAWMAAIEGSVRSVRAGWVSVLVGLGVLVIQSGVALGGTIIHICDDDLAYLPLAERLAQTGDLIEPWSSRRITSFGGASFLEAIYVRFTGQGTFAFVELVLAAGFLYLLLALGWRTSRCRVIGAALGVSVIVWAFQQITAAPVLLPVVLLAGLGSLLVILRWRLETGSPTAGIGVLCGVMAAGVGALRPNLMFFAVLAALGVLVLPAPNAARARLRAALGVLIGLGVAIAPWMLAQYRAVGTPLFPFVQGNNNADVPIFNSRSINSLADRIDRAWAYLEAAPFLGALALVILVVVVCWSILPSSRAVLLTYAGAAATYCVALAATLTSARDQDFQRYAFPVIAATGVLLVIRALTMADGAADRAGGERRLESERVTKLGLALAVAAMLVTVGLLGGSLGRFVRFNEAAEVLRKSLGGTSVVTERYSEEQRRDYRSAQRSLPDGSHALVSVNFPALFHFDDEDITNMDLAGWAAPDGDFPFFTGVGDKVRRMKREGFEYLIVTDPARGECFNGLAHNRGLLDSGFEIERSTAPYTVDFLEDVETMLREHPEAVQSFGDLRVIDLRRIPPER